MGSINNKTITIADMNGDKIADQVFLNYVNGKFNGASWKDGTKLADPKAVCTPIQTQTDSYGNLFFYADAKVITNPRDKKDTGFDGVKDKVVIQGRRHYGYYRQVESGQALLDQYGNLKSDLREDKFNRNEEGRGYLDLYKWSPFSNVQPEIVVQVNIRGKTAEGLLTKFNELGDCQQIDLDNNSKDDYLIIRHYRSSGYRNFSKYQGEIWIGYSGEPVA